MIRQTLLCDRCKCASSNPENKGWAAAHFRFYAKFNVEQLDYHFCPHCAEVIKNSGRLELEVIHPRLGELSGGTEV